MILTLVFIRITQGDGEDDEDGEVDVKDDEDGGESAMTIEATPTEVLPGDPGEPGVVVHHLWRVGL